MALLIFEPADASENFVKSCDHYGDPSKISSDFKTNVVNVVIKFEEILAFQQAISLFSLKKIPTLLQMQTAFHVTFHLVFKSYLFG